MFGEVIFEDAAVEALFDPVNEVLVDVSVNEPSEMLRALRFELRFRG